MVSFLMMLALAPADWGMTWFYISFPRHLNGDFWTKYPLIKFIAWAVFVVVTMGGFGIQLDFIAHRELSSHARQFYLMALLIIEGLPMLAIMIYRYYQDPNSFYWFDEAAKRSGLPKDRK